MVVPRCCNESIGNNVISHLTVTVMTDSLLCFAHNLKMPWHPLLVTVGIDQNDSGR